MDALQFFREQHTLVRSIVNDMVLAGLSDDQMRSRPRENQNSLVWLLWHTARWEDVAMTVLDENSRQTLNEKGWHERMNICRRDVGTGMTPDECAEFNAKVNANGVRAYWDEVGRKTLIALECLYEKNLDDPINETRYRQILSEGIVGNERAIWVKSFFSGRTKAWYLSYVNWHATEHMFGEALSVRGQLGIPLGL